MKIPAIKTSLAAAQVLSASVPVHTKGDLPRQLIERRNTGAMMSFIEIVTLQRFSYKGGLC